MLSSVVHRWLGAFALCALPPAPADAQSWPTRPVKVIVPYATGGPADVYARFIAQRLGDQVARDMTPVGISPPLRMCVVGPPAYYRHHVIPTHPQQLAAHNCINLRLPTHGGLMPWEFARDGEELNLRVSGQWTFNNSGLMLRAALAEGGLAWLPCDLAQQAVDADRLLSVLEDWCPEFEGYYAYYPSRRQASVALRIILDALRGARHPD